jgi:NADH pyrophosphatase NudC (nudix superfamily)
MEKKGLFVKRESSTTGGSISFYRHDFSTMFQNWKILREIDKWNEKGVVELVEAVAEKAKGGKISCPSCLAEVAEKQKFCGNCGHKLVEVAAA